MAKIVLVIPTFNEKESTGKMIKALSEELPKIKGHEMHVLYVDDTSPDKTYEVVRENTKKYNWLHLLMNEEKKGLGAAYAKGFKYAMKELGADYIMEFDADFQHRPDEIKNLVAKIDEGYEYIIGSRYIPGGSIPKHWGFKRKLLSVGGNLVARIGFLMPKVHDLTTGFKITKVKEVMDKIDLDNLYSTSFAYKLQILAQAIQGGAKWVEVPIRFEARKEGKSKIISSEQFQSLKVIFLVQINNPKIQRFLKFGTVGFIGFLVNWGGIEVFRKFAVTRNLANYFSFLKDRSALNVLAERSSWAAAMGAELAIISNFTLNNIWTFKEKKITAISKLVVSFLKFNFASVGAIVIQFAAVGGAVVFFGDTSLVRVLALVFAIVFLIIPYNYSVYNLFIWKTWRLPWQKRSSKK